MIAHCWMARFMFIANYLKGVLRSELRIRRGKKILEFTTHGLVLLLTLRIISLFLILFIGEKN